MGKNMTKYSKITGVEGMRRAERAVRIMAANPEMTWTEIAKGMGMTRPSLMVYVDRLRKQETQIKEGLITDEVESKT